MAPRKRPPNTAEAARNDGCNLLTDFCKRNRAAVACLAAPAVMEDLAATTDEPAQTDPVATENLAATRLA